MPVARKLWLPILVAIPAFAASFALCDAEGEGCGNASGTWIGNDETNGYILTAAHAFDGDDFANRWTYRSRDGRYYRAESVVVHPNYVRVEATNQETAYSLGFDVAIVTLSEPVEDAGEQPLLYTGTQEEGMTLTFVGYGTRGMASQGEDENEPAGAVAAAAEGVIDRVLPLVLNEAGEADGNSLEITLPKEDGSVDNPITGETGGKPVSRNAGLLGGGDSGGGGRYGAGAVHQARFVARARWLWARAADRADECRSRHGIRHCVARQGEPDEFVRRISLGGSARGDEIKLGSWSLWPRFHSHSAVVQPAVAV